MKNKMYNKIQITHCSGSWPGHRSSVKLWLQLLNTLVVFNTTISFIFTVVEKLLFFAIKFSFSFTTKTVTKLQFRKKNR